MSEEATKMHRKVVVNLHSVVQKTSMPGKMCNLWHVRGGLAHIVRCCCCRCCCMQEVHFKVEKREVEGVKLAREIALQK